MRSAYKDAAALVGVYLQEVGLNVVVHDAMPLTINEVVLDAARKDAEAEFSAAMDCVTLLATHRSTRIFVYDNMYSVTTLHIKLHLARLSDAEKGWPL